MPGIDLKQWELTAFRLRYACEKAQAALKEFQEVWEAGVNEELDRLKAAREARTQASADWEERYQVWKRAQVSDDKAKD